MQDTTRAKDMTKLNELELIGELKRLRTQIPDNPSLNPILNVAFDLSRRLESGDVSFDEMQVPCRALDGSRLRSPRPQAARKGRIRRSGDHDQGFHDLRRQNGEGSRIAGDVCQSLGPGAHRHRSDGPSDLWLCRMRFIAGWWRSLSPIPQVT